ncbi:hypothetical protein ON010_g14983 [Phytophthora cinnamomi]|nr:hypothetical protein ON010_g14983 [Phytophthora cinnamomi]
MAGERPNVFAELLWILCRACDESAMPPQAPTPPGSAASAVRVQVHSEPLVPSKSNLNQSTDRARQLQRLSAHKRGADAENLCDEARRGGHKSGANNLVLQGDDTSCSEPPWWRWGVERELRGGRLHDTALAFSLLLGFLGLVLGRGLAALLVARRLLARAGQTRRHVVAWVPDEPGRAAATAAAPRSRSCCGATTAGAAGTCSATPAPRRACRWSTLASSRPCACAPSARWRPRRRTPRWCTTARGPGAPSPPGDTATRRTEPSRAEQEDPSAFPPVTQAETGTIPTRAGNSMTAVDSDSSPGSDVMEGGIMTSNGRRHVPGLTSRGASSESYSERERTGSEETDYAGGHGGGDGFLQTLPGEAVLVRNDNVRVRFLDRIEHAGRLYVTNYRLVFSPAPDGVVDGEVVMGRFSLESANVRRNVREDELPYASDLHSEALVAYQAIPLVTIERVKRKEMVETDTGVLEIVGKDFRRLHFIFEGLVSKQTFSQFDRTYALVRMHALGEPEGKVDEFAKFSLERFDGVNGAVDGWMVYDAEAEFQRMGLLSSTNRWRLSYINDQYELCPTYPSILAVPASVSDSVLTVASKFRSKGRIPVLSWRDRHTGAVICRSSQPLVGLGQKQCDKDVFLIQAIAATNPSSTKLVIIDARPWKNAVAQKTVGRAGYELTEHYETRHATASLKYADMVTSEQNAAAAAAISAGFMATPMAGGAAEASINGDSQSINESSGWSDSDERRQILESMEASLVLTECKLIFMGIENIHAMRKCYHKLMDLCTTKQNNDKWSRSPVS